VPSINSGGISVVSGMLPLLAAASGADALSSDAALSPQAVKINALQAVESSIRFFMVLLLVGSAWLKVQCNHCSLF
jgi:hypothetical protein